MFPFRNKGLYSLVRSVYLGYGSCRHVLLYSLFAHCPVSRSAVQGFSFHSTSEGYMCNSCLRNQNLIAIGNFIGYRRLIGRNVLFLHFCHWCCVTALICGFMIQQAKVTFNYETRGWVHSVRYMSGPRNCSLQHHCPTCRTSSRPIVSRAFGYLVFSAGEPGVGEFHISSSLKK